MRPTYGISFMLWLLSSFSAGAGPNEICADREAFQLAREMVVDESGFGKATTKGELGPGIEQGILPADYTYSIFLREIEQIGVETWVDRFLTKAKAIDAAAGVDPKKLERDIEESRRRLITKLSSDQIKAQNEVYQHYIIVPRQAVAVNFDPNLQRTTCSFDYRVDQDKTVEYFRKILPPDSQELKMILTNAAMEKAIGSAKTAYYSVQADGKGGTNVILLKNNR